jgi:hypothetical protein
VDTIEIIRSDESFWVKLCVGDITALGPEHATDVLVVSSFPGDYSPIPGSVLDSLYRRGLSVAELATEKDVDLRQSFSCWMSRDLSASHAATGLLFKRLLCFEPLAMGTPEEMVGNVFRSLAPFLAGPAPLRTVATPLLATGRQAFRPDRMLHLLTDTACQWIATGMPLRSLLIVCHPSADIEVLHHTFAEVKTRITDQHNRRRTRFTYDAFLSYAHTDSNEAALIEDALLKMQPEMRVFVDRKRLNPGSAWQQEIYETLDNCARVIAVLTPAYLLSKVCLEEFNIGLFRSRETDNSILVPIYLYTAQLPTYMKMLHMLDCRECVDSKVKSACERLAGDLFGN